jgi:hypothetical protein
MFYRNRYYWFHGTLLPNLHMTFCQVYDVGLRTLGILLSEDLVGDGGKEHVAGDVPRLRRRGYTQSDRYETWEQFDLRPRTTSKRLPAMPYSTNKGQGKRFWTTGNEPQ